MALPIPSKVSVVSLVGNAQAVPRGTDVALCAPTAGTVYTLPKLDVEPAAGSYMQGQMLQLRNLTAFTITLTPAAGDTIGGHPTLDVTAQQFIVLVYAGAANWSIVMRVTSAADPEPLPVAVVATPTGDTASTATQTATQPPCTEPHPDHPMTPVKTLSPKQR